MDFHHMCLVVSDMELALRLYRDTLGFSVYIDTRIPDEEGAFFAPGTLDDIFHVRGARSRMVMLASATGAKLELQQPENPQVQRTPREYLGYGHTGITELALRVSDIDQWFQTIRTAGYQTQTEYVWAVGGGRLKSFLFHDHDGNLVQLVEEFTL
ncbi:VOC family protein [Pseudomonas aeruginosa]|uniref:VOC family protein n=1 Tax=Pseudomonadaceae TaxID=135621 RepID=UPI00071BABEB|nr:MULTISPECIES: VOC family protein [Pseudomonas]AXL70900.1 Glyoxalase family protein [Pseudomonas aeruginosa]KSS00932.1 glyoxalase/bleomycin resistance/dioxygenase family protein [Pseudomonas aeruginosa]MBA1201211.1 VOC family protein [Pseudomonas capeferrum]MBG6489568.1 VOC family protein [Pseudomonas aeruginosa]MBV5982975.1 VOC family protein [Pseudomonas aeruginosa]